MYYISYETGKKYYLDKEQYFLNNCPICNIPLLWNSYKDLQVSDQKESYVESIELKIECCRKCGDIFLKVI